MTKRVIPRTRPDPRRLASFRHEVAALLTTQGYTPREAKSAVDRHGPLVRAAWSARVAPCGTADQIRCGERGKMQRDPAHPTREEKAIAMAHTAKTLAQSGNLCEAVKLYRKASHTFSLLGDQSSSRMLESQAFQIESARFLPYPGGQRDPGRPFKKCPTGTQIQSLIFSRPRFTQKTASAWAKHHGFTNRRGGEIYPKTLRLRQRAPSLFKPKSFRTIRLTTGVQAIIACPK